MSSWPNPIKSTLNLRASGGQRPRNRSFPWCRRPNGFSDNPKWRAVKARSGIDLCIVLAFVNRLEELGNDAANRGDIRGSVAGFKAEDFAAALDITAEDVNRLFAALEHPDIGWIADGIIADFIDRNPDIEDPTSGERKRRERSRAKILSKLRDLAKFGKISSGERTDIENNLMSFDQQQLVQLQVELEAKSVGIAVTRDLRLSQRDSVTPSANPIEVAPTVSKPTEDVTRASVTVTVDQNRVFKETPIPSTPTAVAVGPIGLAREAVEIAAVSGPDPATWLKQDGLQLIMDRMAEPRERAMTRLSNWSGQVGDCAVLVNILQGAENRSGPAFHMEVADQIRRLAH
ncbi:hypothetical protein [Bradyrhizobium lablabi]|uniref:hypothetical protein n=1 Tax=Bradyrhizobium lablabi TaxID=722472 RepID=UPI001BA60FAC|nr:hypothetical protein [Bradyrhizobium lablabi]MBR0693283.1 hypothetical protein [Bradyrhizobium lablabi]